MSTESLSDSEHSYRQFFAEMVEAYSQRRPNWYKLKPGPRNYLTFSAGISGVRFGWVFHQGPEFSVELYISTSVDILLRLKPEESRALGYYGLQSSRSLGVNRPLSRSNRKTLGCANQPLLISSVGGL
ncbi:DUF4268 domain-containing protein [Halorubrum yunnanense]|uniref:DUF4268 domain-containing protein n=1 Tax=Halorubrum yunnanense TaxID=1526162 RepID=A0ABD5Y805_9EURY|nr:DUF4268 domain-containing protein [Halorubrum yunnanense]